MGRDVSAYNPHPGLQDELTAADKVTPAPFGRDVTAFTRFSRGTNPPPRTQVLDPAKVAQGSAVFNSLQCAVCHVPQWKTVPAGTVLGDLTVPPELGDKTLNPYSDFMLHDVGTGDGIVQTQQAQRPLHSCTADTVKKSKLADKGNPHIHRVVEDMYKYVDDDKNPAYKKHGKNDNGNNGQRYMDTGLVETADMMRTAPLWGVRARPQLMHDGRSLTLDEAIVRHAHQAEAAKQAYVHLSDDDRCALLTFLMSL